MLGGQVQLYENEYLGYILKIYTSIAELYE